MLHLGIDVSKKTLDLCLLHEGVKGGVKTRKPQCCQCGNSLAQ